MNRMEYYRPETINDAFARKSAESFYIAGGTDLGVMLADAPKVPAALIDLSGIDELKGTSTENGMISIGACARIAGIAASAGLPDALTQGASAIGSPQIRNMATIGGNICNASPCGDTLTPLAVLDAVFQLQGPEGKRTVPAADFFTGPKKTVLKEGEILVRVEIPVQAEGSLSGFKMTGKRNGQAISQVNMAVMLMVENGIIKTARVAAGSVAPVPLRLSECEKKLEGAALKDFLPADKGGNRALADLAAAAEKEVLPISDVRAGENYRRNVSGSLLADIIAELALKGVGK